MNDILSSTGENRDRKFVNSTPATLPRNIAMANITFPDAKAPFSSFI